MNMFNTSLCYLEKDNSYLMLHRIKKENDINHDKWIGIGGKFEVMESPEDCLKREALEETGLTLHSWRYCGIVTFIQNNSLTEYMHLFWSDDFSGQLLECDEGVLEWYPKSRIRELNLWEGDLIFHKLMDEKRPFFSLKLHYEEDTLLEAFLDGQALRRVSFGNWSL